MFLVERAYHLFSVDPECLALGNCGRCRHAQRLGVGNALLSQEVARAEQGDGRFLATRGDHGELGLALLDVKNSIRRITL